MKQRAKRNNAKVIKFNLRNRISWRGKQMRLARKENTDAFAQAGYTKCLTSVHYISHGE